MCDVVLADFAEPSAPEGLAARVVSDGVRTRSASSDADALGARATNARAKSVSGTKLAAATRERSLAPREAHLVAIVDAAGVARVTSAVTDLEHALALRCRSARRGGRSCRPRARRTRDRASDT